MLALHLLVDIGLYRIDFLCHHHWISFSCKLFFHHHFLKGCVFNQYSCIYRCFINKCSSSINVHSVSTHMHQPFIKLMDEQLFRYWMVMKACIQFLKYLQVFMKRLWFNLLNVIYFSPGWKKLWIQERPSLGTISFQLFQVAT